MLLAVDIGNSSIDFGVFGEDGRLLAKSKLSTVKTKSTDEYAAILSGILPLNGVDPKKISAAILSSVVPLVTSAISRAVRKLCGVTPMEVGPGVKTGLKIKIDMQNQLGADIVANAVATVAAFPPPAVIVDIGTATTFTVIDKEGILDGVIIAPGLRVSMDALASSASELPDAPLVAPKKLIGKNTEDSMSAGVLYGHAFLIDGFLRRIAEELKAEKMSIVGTGGLAGLVLPLCFSPIVGREDLTLTGLRLLYLKNRK